MFGMRLLQVVSTKVSDLSRSSFASSYMGMKVYSRSGEFVGNVFDIVFQGNTFQGILVRGRERVFIGKEFFTFSNEDHLFLNINPVTNFIGKLVFDSEGRRLGRIVEIERASNDNVFKAIKVKESFYSKPFSIPAGDISVSEQNIILKTSYV